MMFTSKEDAVRLLLEEAARWHAEAARAPEAAAQLLAEYRERYESDATFRAEIDEGARQGLEQAEQLKRRTLQVEDTQH